MDRADQYSPQALLEEIERHGEKVEECQRFAKQYINAIKVRLLPLAILALGGVLGPEIPRGGPKRSPGCGPGNG